MRTGVPGSPAHASQAPWEDTSLLIFQTGRQRPWEVKWFAERHTVSHQENPGGEQRSVWPRSAYASHSSGRRAPYPQACCRQAPFQGHLPADELNGRFLQLFLLHFHFCKWLCCQSQDQQNGTVFMVVFPAHTSSGGTNHSPFRPLASPKFLPQGPGSAQPPVWTARGRACHLLLPPELRVRPSHNTAY